MVFEEFCVLADRSCQLLPFLLIQINGRPFLEIIVFLGRRRILISSLPAVPRSLDIIPLHYFLFSIEDISHNDEVTSAYLVTLIVLLYQLMQAKEFSNECIWVLFEVIVVIFKNSS